MRLLKKLKSFTFVTLGTFVLTFLYKLFEHRFLEWANHKLDEAHLVNRSMPLLVALVGWLGAHPLWSLAIGGLSSCLLMVALFLLFRPRRIRILSPTDGATVSFRQEVSGVAEPGMIVQVLVLSNDGWWYPQKPSREDVERSLRNLDRTDFRTSWTAECVFGTKDSPPGSEYRVVAVTGKRVSERAKPLPSGLIKSRKIRVLRALEEENLAHSIMRVHFTNSGNFGSSIDRIAESVGVSREAALRSLRELEERGLVHHSGDNWFGGREQNWSQKRIKDL